MPLHPQMPPSLRVQLSQAQAELLEVTAQLRTVVSLNAGFAARQADLERALDELQTSKDAADALVVEQEGVSESGRRILLDEIELQRENIQYLESHCVEMSQRCRTSAAEAATAQAVALQFYCFGCRLRPSTCLVLPCGDLLCDSCKESLASNPCCPSCTVPSQGIFVLAFPPAQLQL